MIPDLSALPPARRAQLIYAQAHDAIANKLWRAALGDAESRDPEGMNSSSSGMSMESLLASLGKPATPAMPDSGFGPCPANDALIPNIDALSAGIVPQPAVSTFVGAPAFDPAMVSAVSGTSSPLTLGPNARYSAAFAANAERTGVPAPALMAIVDAEAGKGPGGAWNPHSRNPRSSAAGLGQFLSGTWQDLAQTPGTWLNGVARQRGWLDARGRVMPGARADLLALRYDPEASIAGVADLAKLNLDRLERDGFHVRESDETLAKAAYLSHHLGIGDTRRFLGTGLDPQRARTLLIAQVGAASANERIGRAGGATQAHRQWLLGYIDKRIRPGQYAA